jgi:hypothetical protein
MNDAIEHDEFLQALTPADPDRLRQDPDAGDIYADRDIPNDRHAWVIPITMGRARIIIGRRGEGWLADGW